ncbi:ABC-type amino acid transport substrate-binding protein [Breznakia sp. PF5-3]|uniref:substrate-binding periplasmic protein n=1 Tax=unclassified Breznakia TaxID=2623764 RepID=UPI002405471C|nr:MULTISPECIES: transporter substrate-binding domain-containing protein [unclassified Breznakia]MDF9825780.1 ABC-type amino acid transport substrate-binding protein [Breznakia sp. PM6-1]MDF9836585.1 ABC-type amino acid transport substrate-binding protein [Breznakia sp. PF5-3]MDF9838813.1 ABC-type amino acid transport substrate-binding protein [Breznakia sp. PFB2-8]MDF9860839.1 ABC-type amino acid transport substrate-binding protein [Breznakia sp. PH5-24]
MKKILSLMLVCGLLLVGCGESDSGDDKTITVFTNSGYPPYEMVDENGDLYGFDIDVMNRAAEIAGYEIKWEDIDFDAIIDSIKTDKGQAAIAGMTPTSDRSKQVDFSELYYTSEEMQNVVLVKKDSGLKTTADIKGKKVGIQMGTVQETVVDAIADDYDLTFEKLKDYTSLAQELENDVIDLMIVEKAVATELMQKNDNLEYYVLEEGADLAGNAIAFKKGSKIKADFDKAIKQMKKDGELDELIKKWFGE